MNDQAAWGEDYAETSVDPELLHAYAERCEGASDQISQGEFLADTGIQEEAWTSWRDFVDKVSMNVNPKYNMKAMTDQARLIPSLYDEIWRATGARIDSLSGYLEELAQGVRHTADAIEQEDYSNSVLISDSMDPETDTTPGEPAYEPYSAGKDYD